MMKDSTETAPQAYATPREWLEGKRRFVQVLRQFCGGDGADTHQKPCLAGLDLWRASLRTFAAGGLTP